MRAENPAAAKAKKPMTTIQTTRAAKVAETAKQMFPIIRTTGLQSWRQAERKLRPGKKARKAAKGLAAEVLQTG